MARGTSKTAQYGQQARTVKQTFYIKPGKEAAAKWQQLADDVGYGDNPGDLFVIIARAWISALKSLI